MKKIVFGFFLAYLFTGIFIYNDYGLSWDEEFNRFGTALPEFNYVFNDDKDGLLKSSEKYHGPAFELLLFSIERASHISDSRQVYFIRHLVTFLLFYFSAVVLYFLSKRIFQRQSIALICVLMYVLSPRIFGESFYNSKDIGFLSCFTVSLFTFYKFIEKKNFRNAILHSLVCGFAIDIRITGILLPLFTIIFFIADAFMDRGSARLNKKVVILFGYLFFQFGFIVLFWPVMWIDPFHHLAEAWNQMSLYPWHGSMLYMGKLISEKDLPWHYLPVWIAITIPFMYVLLFVAGLVVLFARMLRFNTGFYRDNKYLLYAAGLVITSLLAIVIRQSVVYDGWRHLYFLYGPVVILAGSGVQYIYDRLSGTKSGHQVFNILITANFILIACLMIRDHPHQHAWFNQAARAFFSPVHLNFETDYWGLSYREGLESILEKNTSAAVHVKIANDPGILNADILKPEDRSRIHFHEDIRLADYYLAEFRGKIVNPDTIGLKIIEGINSSSARMLTIYEGLHGSSRIVEVYKSMYNFEDTSVHRNNSNRTAASGQFSNMLGEHAEASDVVDYLIDSTYKSGLMEVRIQSLINPTRSNPNVLIVFSVTRNDSAISWNCDYLQNRLSRQQQWTKVRWNQLIPSNAMPGDKVRMYIWAVDRAEVFVDDFEVSIVRFENPRPVPVL